MTNPFQPEDLFLYQTINEVNCLPSVDIAACTVESVNQGQDSRTSAIWAVPLDGSGPWQFTGGSAIENTPRWSPDGSKLAFLSSRKGMLQIYLINRNGGEAKQLGSLPSAVMTIEWASNARHLLAICNMTVDPDLRGARPRDSSTKQQDAPKVVWRLPYKADGTGYILASEKHLFVVDALSGNHVQLTDGPFNIKSASWSPDSKRIAFTRTREGVIAHQTDVWIMDADGKNCHRVSEEISNTQYPRWAPDGSKIVFTGSKHEGDAQIRLWLYDIQAKTISALGSEDIEVVAGDSVQWAEDSSHIFFVRAWRGRQEVASLTIGDGTLEPLVRGDRQIDYLAATRQKLVFVAENACTPNEIYCTSLNGEAEGKLSNFNAWWKDRAIPELEARSFTVPDDKEGTETIEGWLLKPADLHGPYPLLVDVHGGPASYAYLKYAWHSYWHVLISQGWVILALNPVGSSSFGREFSNRLRGRWGELDLKQQLAAIKLLQEERTADERVAIAGKSYGGYFSAWAITHSPIFRSAVISAPVANLEAHYGTSDSGYYSDPYAMQGEPHHEQERFQALSPVSDAEKRKAPALILQGEGDERCPRGQAEELFTRFMTTSETPAELVLYPGGDHHFFENGKPSHSVDAVKRLAEWTTRWIDVGQSK